MYFSYYINDRFIIKFLHGLHFIISDIAQIDAAFHTRDELNRKEMSRDDGIYISMRTQQVAHLYKDIWGGSWDANEASGAFVRMKRDKSTRWNVKKRERRKRFQVSFRGIRFVCHSWDEILYKSCLLEMWPRIVPIYKEMKKMNNWEIRFSAFDSNMILKNMLLWNCKYIIVTKHCVYIYIFS